MTSPLPRIRRLHAVAADERDALAEVLRDCVAGGASVGFMQPLAPARARAFWDRVAAAVHAGERALLVAEDAQGIAGTVQLVLAQPDNQPHRADLAKMLVHRRARRLGLGAALLSAAEDAARAHGKTLLVLDTASDEAERLYRRGGWQYVGEVPDFALWPHGGPCATRFFYRRIGDARHAPASAPGSEA